MNAVAVHHPFTIVSNTAVLLWCWVPVNICCSLVRVRAGVLVCVRAGVLVCVRAGVLVCVCVCVCVCVFVGG